MSSFENYWSKLKGDAEELQRADDERSGEGDITSGRISYRFGKMNKRIIQSTHPHLKIKNDSSEKDE
ncbi:MAG: hypothetical protein KAT32_02155 [Candidatus Moranbacteria bacterium]|nr:hypothetical protein [Candidatus Moranbacteria bacterium]